MIKVKVTYTLRGAPMKVTRCKKYYQCSQCGQKFEPGDYALKCVSGSSGERFCKSHAFTGLKYAGGL